MLNGNRITISLITLLLLTTPLLSLSEARADAPISVVIDNERQSYSQEPILLNGSTVVPLRAFFEKLGASVYWIEETKTVIGLKDYKKIVLTINDDTAFINEQPIKLEQPATILNGNTMVPLRFISEATGASVNWNNDTRTATIKTMPSESDDKYVLDRAAPFRLEHHLDGEPLTIKAPNSPPISTETIQAIQFPVQRKWKTFSTPHLNIFYSDNEDYVYALSSYLENIYVGLSNKLGHSLAFKPAVYLINSTEYDKYLKEVSGLSWSIGRWEPSLKTTFLRVDPLQLGAGLLITFQHEMTHALTLNAPESKPEGIPLWFVEGAAAYREKDAPFNDYSREIYIPYLLHENGFLKFKEIPLNNSDWPSVKVTSIYAQAQSMYGYLAATYGEDAINRIFYKQGAFEDKLRDITHISLEELEQNWLAAVKLAYSHDDRTYGRMYNIHNDWYVGELNHGAKDGKGLLVFHFNQQLGVYFGDFQNNVFDGKGIYYYDDVVYEGEFRDGNRAGTGKTYRDGKLVVEGEFRKSRQNTGWEFYKGNRYLPNGTIEKVDLP